MYDTLGVNQQKERILSLIKLKGPSLPVQIARAINVSPLFAGAFLSELYAEKRIKISNMRVGSSPLYYLSGQEGILENFVNNLNLREREAFFALKNEKVLDDEKQTPIIRVALRAIKDFAVPLRTRINEDVKTFWRYFLLSEDNAIREIQRIIMPIEKKVIQEKLVEAKEEVGKIKEGEKVEEKKDKEEEIIQKETIIEKKTEVKKERIKKPKKARIQEFKFSKYIKDYLSEKDIELIEHVLEKKREFCGKIRIDMLFGKQEFFLVAKDKKNVSDIDLTLALQQAQAFKMPVLVMSYGELSKKAQEYLKEWKNLIKFEKVKME